tara:strand:- start:2389 stop:3360 length:972 start_codon:yes stop_codon:yes gene_type:complete
MKNKKAMTMKFIITMVILILSFGVILLFYFLYPWGDRIDEDACHQSIILRSTFNYKFFEIGKETIPLKCQTKKICLTVSGEDCKDFEQVLTPIVKIKVKNEEDIKSEIADALYDCNSLFGEGKLNFMPSPDWGEERYCLICARIAFDDKAKEEIKQIKVIELFEFMSKKADSQKRSYLEYVYPGLPSGGSSEKILEEIKNKNPAAKDIPLGNWVIDFNVDGGHAITSQILKAGKWAQKLSTIGTFVVAVGGTILGVALSSTGVLSPLGIAIIGFSVKAGVVGGGLAFAYMDPSGEFVYIAPSLTPYDIDSLTKLECNSFETAP